MNPKKLLILGGYGNTGKPLAHLLLQESDVSLILAGRSLEKARLLANELNREFSGERVSGESVDASDSESMRKAFQGVDMVVVASSTARFVWVVAQEAIQAGCDYLDIQYSTKKVAVLQALSNPIEHAGRCFITDGGFHPGLPAALICYGAQSFDTLVTANVGSVIKQDWASINLLDDTAIELVEELGDYNSLVYQNGKWQKAGSFDFNLYRKIDFGTPFGRQSCAPMFLEEMRQIPELFPSLIETGFFVGGFNGFVDWLVLPMAMVGQKVWRQGTIHPMARLMRWGLQRFSKPPYGIVLKLEAQGLKDGIEKSLQVSLSHSDGYMFTAIPVAACILQYLDGSIRKPGLWTQANLVEPQRLIRDMQRMGVDVKRSETAGNSPSAGATA